MAERPKATAESLAVLHAHTETRHDTFPVCLTLAEIHSINKVREMVAARFLLEGVRDGQLPPAYRQLEAMDALCDQLGCEDGPNRLRAREAGARDPMSPADVARFIGEDVVVPMQEAAE